MMARVLRWLLIASALLGCLGARAFTCSSVTSPGVNISYYNKTAAVVQGTFTVTCTRNSGDPNTLTYSVAVDDGLSGSKKNGNTATLGNSKVRYETYVDSSCATLWSSTNAITDSMSWSGNTTGSQSRQTSYWICAESQNIAGAGGTYTDTLQMTLSYTGGTSITGNMPVEIYAPANCTFTTPPGTITLNYVAFGPQVANSTTFAVQCTTGLPYTMATNVPEGVLVDLRYILSLSATAGTGSGVPQSYSVTATIPAGQGGSCTTGTCTASQTHTVIISY